jgi:hypothetical protein
MYILCLSDIDEGRSECRSKCDDAVRLAVHSKFTFADNRLKYLPDIFSLNVKSFAKELQRQILVLRTLIMIQYIWHRGTEGLRKRIERY